MIDIKSGHEFKKQSSQASDNLSNLLVPVPTWKLEYNKRQDELLKEIFG
jgi:hypothetical protein